MSASLFLGVDIGAQGAVAIITADGRLVEIHDMPVLADGPANRRSVNGPLLVDIIFKSHANCAFVEHVAARPGEGAVGAFAFGRSRGVVEGVLAAAGIPTKFIAPAAWKKCVGLSMASKDAARAEAIRRWPDHAALFARKKDDGRAEAALIAMAGLTKFGGSPDVV